MRFSKLCCLATLLAVCSVAHAGSVPSWCASNEYTAFNCRVGHKVVSVCTSPHLSRDRGYVQYRFGQPGKAMELAYPAMDTKPDEAFLLSSTAVRHGPGESTPAFTLHFANQGVRYAVFSDNNPEYPRGAVLVDTVKKPLAAYLACDAGTIESRLESLWNSTALPVAR